MRRNVNNGLEDFFIRFKVNSDSEVFLGQVLDKVNSGTGVDLYLVKCTDGSIRTTTPFNISEIQNK